MRRGAAIVARGACRLRGHRWQPVVYTAFVGQPRPKVLDSCSRCDAQRSRSITLEEYVDATGHSPFAL